MAEPASRAADRVRAVLLILGAAALFSVAAVFVKGLSGAIPLAQVIFCRSAFAVPALLPLLLREGGLRALRTGNPRLHALRLAFGLLGMAGAFYGYAHLPLATVSALGFTMPLFLTALSVPLLGERVGWARATAVGVGFAGVLLITDPYRVPVDNLLAIGAVLAGALGWALSMITIRRMGTAGESGATIVLWFALGASVVAGAVALPGWVAPTAGQWGLLVGTGVVSAAAQVLMTEAYRRGEATLLAPFEYSAIVWTVTIGLLVFGELPDLLDFAGIAVLVASGLFIWWREMAGRGTPRASAPGSAARPPG